MEEQGSILSMTDLRPEERVRVDTCVHFVLRVSQTR